MCCNMGTRYFYDVAKTVATRMDTEMNVALVYNLHKAPATSEMTTLVAIFPGMTNEGGSKLKIYYYDTF